jgi:lysophospholipase L1-like esterase
MPARMRNRPVLSGLLFLLFAGSALAAAPEKPLVPPERWLPDIEALTANDQSNPPPAHGVVFVGSSSIRLWTTLETDFGGIPVINRGFGGSYLSHTVHFAERIILPYRPRAVVVYAGENDLWDGKAAEVLAADFEALRLKIRTALPRCRLIFLSIKLSPSRLRIHNAVREANSRIERICAADPHCRYIDVATPMLTTGGAFRSELYVNDQLHLSPSGYALWRDLIAPHLKP